MTPGGLAMAAIVCGVLSVGACFMDWSEPARSLADLQAEAHRARLEGDLGDPTPLVQETARAYPIAGVKDPFNGVWVIVASIVGCLVAGAGALLAGMGTASRSTAEKTLWAAGAVFAIGAVLTLLDGSPSKFEFGMRASGWWLTLALCLAATFCSTFASARLPRAVAGGGDAEAPVDDEDMLHG